MMISRLGADEGSITSITLFVGLLCICIVIGHLLEKYRWINESITALLIGLCSGALILVTSRGTSSRILVFNEELFFIYLLPPIIFNAGFQVKKKQFFRNFINIMRFGAIGTLTSFVIISIGSSQLFKYLDVGFLETADYLALGAILSATDSVCTLQVLNQNETPLLYSLVFGEGVVNDATSVVLFHAIQKFDLSHITLGIAMHFIGNFLYLFVTSTLLGISVGLFCAFITKLFYFGRHSTDREVALMILMAYLSYMISEVLDLSGILTVFFCGIVMSHYTWHNVTESSRITTRHAFATMSSIAEIFIFLYVGMDALDIEKWRSVSKSPGTLTGVSLILLGLVLLGRAAFVFPLCFTSNLFAKSQSSRIGLRQQFIIWWAGLMRGAVSIALAYNQFTLFGHTQLKGNAIMITGTITIVLFSTVVFGLLTKPLIRLIRLQEEHSSNVGFSAPSSPRTLTLPLTADWQEDSKAGSDGQGSFCNSRLKMFLSMPTNTVHHYWRMFDDAVMRPAFGGRGFAPRVPRMPSEETLH